MNKYLLLMLLLMPSIASAECNTTHSQYANITMDFINYSYTLSPTTFDAYENETIMLSLINRNNNTVFIETKFAELMPAVDTQNLTIGYCQESLLYVKYNQPGTGLYLMNITSSNNITYINPAIQFNIKKIPVPDRSRTKINLDVHDCLNLTEYFYNTTAAKYELRNITVCPMTDTCQFSDVDSDLDLDNINNLKSTLDSYITYLNTEKNATKNITEIENTKILWEVVPEAQNLLQDLRDQTSCDYVCSKMVTDATISCNSELMNKKTELTSVYNQLTNCTTEKGNVMNMLSMERGTYDQKLSFLSESLSECKLNNSEQKDKITADIMKSEVEPLKLFSVGLVLFLSLIAILEKKRNQKPKDSLYVS